MDQATHYKIVPISDILAIQKEVKGLPIGNPAT